MFSRPRTNEKIFCIVWRIVQVIVDEDSISLSEIDEALGYLRQTLKDTGDKDSFMAIVDELLDARNEMRS